MINLNAGLSNMEQECYIYTNKNADDNLLIDKWSQNVFGQDCLMTLLVILLVYFQVSPFKSRVQLSDNIPRISNKGAEIEVYK